MGIQKKTLRIAEMLVEHPEITARVFSLNANGSSTATLHEQINSEFSHVNGFIPLTTTTVRNLLHRARPYDHPKVYLEVKKEDEDRVRTRFKKMVKPRGSKKKAKTCARNHIPLLNEVLEARVQYEQKLDEAVAAGMSKRSVEAWCSVVADGSLTQEKGDEL